MFNSTNREDDTNFWLSYADLMAGLLFVFILLIGAIVVKSIVLKANLDKQESSLVNSIEKLLLRDEEVDKLRQLLAKRSDELKDSKNELVITKDDLKLKIDEIVNLNNILLSSTTQIDNFNSKIIILQDSLEDSSSRLNQQSSKIEDYEDRVLILSSNIGDKNEALRLQDDKLLSLLQALDEKETAHDTLIAKLQEQKAKIKGLTGIKIRVISELKQALGDKVEIDSKSGSLRLSSNILFSKNSSTLKPSAKKEIKKLFIDYIGTLTSNKKISPHIDRISIEGHTDSDGAYLYNLNLSQKRAYAVMNYLLTLKYVKQNNIKPLLVASGRSYLDPIYNKLGKEDKESSRRIEIKFTLKNDDAMNQIERILDYE